MNKTLPRDKLWKLSQALALNNINEFLNIKATDNSCPL